MDMSYSGLGAISFLESSCSVSLWFGSQSLMGRSGAQGRPLSPTKCKTFRDSSINSKPIHGQTFMVSKWNLLKESEMIAVAEFYIRNCLLVL